MRRLRIGVIESIRSFGIDRYCGLLIACFLVFSLVAVVIAFTVASPRQYTNIRPLMSSGFWWCFCALTLVVYLRLRLDRGSTALTWYGRCGQCTFSLRGLPVDDDRCVVCPECAAAWRSDQIAPARVLDAAAIEAMNPPRGVLGLPVLATTIDDAMNRPLPLAKADLSNLDEADRERIPQAVRDSIARAAGSWVLRLALAAGMIVLGLAASAALIFVFGLFLYPRFSWLPGALLGMVVAVLSLLLASAPILYFFSLRWIRPSSAFVRQMLRSGLCPSCAHAALVTIPGAADHVTCAHCGGTWRVPPASR